MKLTSLIPASPSSLLTGELFQCLGFLSDPQVLVYQTKHRKIIKKLNHIIHNAIGNFSKFSFSPVLPAITQKYNYSVQMQIMLTALSLEMVYRSASRSQLWSHKSSQLLSKHASVCHKFSQRLFSLTLVSMNVHILINNFTLHSSKPPAICLVLSSDLSAFCTSLS